MGALVIGGIALALGEGIVGSLIASGILKAGGKLWGFSEKELKKEITRASEAAIHHFNASFGGKYFSGGETLKAFFDSPTMEKELGKIVCTDYEIPNVKTLTIAFEEMGGFRMFSDLTEDGFAESMMTFIEKFRVELADVIEHRRNTEAGLLDTYMRQVAEHCGRLDFVGIPDPKQKKDLQLEDIFITLRARERRPEGDVFPEEDGEEEEIDLRRVGGMGQPRESAPVKLNDALRDSKKMVILGGPGAGKTTMLRYVALMLAKGQAGEIGLPDGLIPIFVELNRFASRDEQQQPLLDFACGYADSHMNVKLPPNFFESYLQQGKCVVLLDGLDEVATLSQRVEVRKVVSSFANRHTGNTFVVTSRIAGYNEASLSDDFQHFEVCDFTEEDVAEFAEKWYRAREGEAEVVADRATDLVNAIKQNPRVTTLARNPLMLTIIALIHRVEARLPTQRIKLYDKCTESLLETWEMVKNTDGDELMSEEDKRRRLEWIAYWMQNMPGKVGRERTVKRAQLQQKLVEFLMKKGKVADIDEAKTEAKLFLDHIRKRTGVLIEGGMDRYSFVHLTFQEYFAACELHSRLLAATMTVGIDKFWEQELKPRLHDPRWQEVILLLMGKLNEVSEEAAGELVKRILNADSEHEEILHRDLFLASECLADDVNADALRQDIFHRLFSLFRKGKYSGLRTRASAALVAMRASRYAGEVTHALIEALGDKHSAVQIGATSALGKLGTASPDVISALIETLGHKHSNVQSSAASALGKLGTASPDVISALIETLRDKHSSAQSSAAYALGKLGTASLDVISALIETLRDKHSNVRKHAAYALGKLGTASPDVISALIEALGDEHSGVRKYAVHALGKLGTPDAIVALTKALGDEHSDVRYSAAEALGKLGTSDAIVALIEALGNEDVYVRIGAASALVDLGTDSLDAIVALIEALGNEDSYVRSRAVSALWNLGTPDAIVALIEVLGHENSYVRIGAAEALVGLGTASPDAIAVLIEALGHGDSYVRISSAYALGDLGTASPNAISALIEALGDKHSGVQIGAASALERLGTASPDAISAFIEALGHEERNVRISAADALGKLGGSSEDAINILPGKLDDEEDSGVANSIFEAIYSLVGEAEAGRGVRG